MQAAGGSMARCNPAAKSLHFYRDEDRVATITHEQLSARLQELQLLLPADALHGAMTGLACAGIEPGHAIWLEHLAECLDGTDLGDQLAAMTALQTLIAHDLADDNLGFQLLLPDGDEFLSVRAKALARWSESFVCGFVAVTRDLSDDDRDLLNDIAAISQIDDGESDEETQQKNSELNNPENAASNEHDFMELCEYVRMGAIDLYRESRGAAMTEGHA
jgi:uncharacterized protein YgfB (UPF0149 family)